MGAQKVKGERENCACGTSTSDAQRRVGPQESVGARGRSARCPARGVCTVHGQHACACGTSTSDAQRRVGPQESVANHSAQPIGSCFHNRAPRSAHTKVTAASSRPLCARRGSRQPHQKACGRVAMYVALIARGGLPPPAAYASRPKGEPLWRQTIQRTALEKSPPY